MNIKSAILGLAAAAMLIIGSASAAVAGPFEDANAYLGAKYGVPDFHLNPAEFGNSNVVRLIHLGAEIIVEKVKGAVVVYTPADPGNPGSPLVKAVFRDQGAGYSEPAQTRSTMATCGPGHWFIYTVGTGENNKWCVAAHLVGGAGGLVQVSPEIPAVPAVAPTPRSCTMDTAGDGKDIHSC